MKFNEFRLIKVDFSINQEFNIKGKKVPINPEIAIHHEFRKKQKELVVSLGIRQMTGNMPFYFEVVSAGLFRFEQIPESGYCQLFSVNYHQGFILNGFHSPDYAAIL